MLLGIQILKEIKYVDYYYQKFLMERYMKKLNFSKTKRIETIEDMRRDYYHFFIYDSIIMTEDKMLSSFFSYYLLK